MVHIVVQSLYFDSKTFHGPCNDGLNFINNRIILTARNFIVEANTLLLADNFSYNHIPHYHEVLYLWIIPEEESD